MQRAARQGPPQKQTAGIWFVIRIIVDLLGGGNRFRNILFANTPQRLVTHFVTGVLTEQNSLELERSSDVFDRRHREILAGSLPIASVSADRLTGGVVRDGTSGILSRMLLFAKDQSLGIVSAHFLGFTRVNPPGHIEPLNNTLPADWLGDVVCGTNTVKQDSRAADAVRSHSPRRQTKKRVNKFRNAPKYLAGVHGYGLFHQQD